MFGWLQRKPLLEEETVNWLFDVYEWALRHFDATIFQQHTRLVAPTDEFFPGRADSPQAMAELIFGHVRHYAAMDHWPCRVVANSHCPVPTRVIISGAIRRIDGKEDPEIGEEGRLLLQYEPDMVRNPEAMIASFAHTLAHHLASLAPEPPPGGEQNWPHTTEVLAIFLGFGLMLANSALNVRIRRCGSCAPPPPDRQSWLSQYDTTYALAIFCALKGIPAGRVTANLKPALRGWFRCALKEASHHPRLQRLIESPDR